MGAARQDSPFCACASRIAPSTAFGHLADELRELFSEPSLDELSDVCFAWGRLVGSLLGRAYVRTPFDGRHRRKMHERMTAHGCVRSGRHLRDGACPSLPPVLYGDPVPDVWHEENGTVSDVWGVTVDHGSYASTFWFYSLDAARRFVDERRASERA